MGLAAQYLKGGVPQAQFGLEVADYTTNGIVANEFLSIKDKDDNLIIMCGNSSTSSSNKMGIIKIDKAGSTKKKAILDWNYSGVGISGSYSSMTLHRDNNFAMITATRASDGGGGCLYWSIPLDFVDGALISEPSGNNTVLSKFAIYQDRYIWVASGTTVKIYDYKTKVELASYTIGTLIYANILVDTDNVCYVPFKDSGATFNQLVKLVYNNTPALQPTTIIANEYPTSDFKALVLKQMLLDKYGDLIILTNSGTASTLLKYTTTGVQVGTTLSLGGPFYNLNTDKDGNYYYSNALGTYKITANTAQGQAFTGVGTKIRGSGMVTYGNSICGYNPAVFGPQE